MVVAADAVVLVAVLLGVALLDVLVVLAGGLGAGRAAKARETVAAPRAAHVIPFARHDGHVASPFDQKIRMSHAGVGQLRQVPHFDCGCR